MAQIRLKQQARGTVNGEAGQVVETDEHHAEAFVRGGYAERVDKPTPSAVEAATDREAEEAETATEARPARGRRTAGKG